MEFTVQGSGTLFDQSIGTIKITITQSDSPDHRMYAFSGGGFTDTGEYVPISGKGIWEQLPGETKFRFRAMNISQRGDVFLTDGYMDLERRVFSGTGSEWT